MNTAPLPAASRPPRAPSEEPIAEESLSAHARRALLARVRARIAAFLDAGIALLQGVRKKVGGAQDAGEDEDRPGSKRERPEARKRAAPPDEAAAESPKPRRRLRTFLIHVSVMLAGGIGGGALAYNQYQKQLGQLLEESLRQEAALVKKIKPGAKTLATFEEERARRAEAEKKLALSLAEYSNAATESYSVLESLLDQQITESRRLEAALAEKDRSGAETQKALDEAQARRTEAEEKLVLSLAEHSKSTTEKQKQLDAAEKQLAALHAGEATRSVQRQAPASRRSDGSKSRPARSGNCALDTKNVDTLKSCIDDFNQ
ncbi:MAG: hypothetical protein U0938_00285 [Thiobacillus sp.]|nr:hypothetical protein [Thiobacillus sp.]